MNIVSDDWSVLVSNLKFYIQAIVTMNPSPKTIELRASRSNEIRGSRELHDNSCKSNSVFRLLVGFNGFLFLCHD